MSGGETSDGAVSGGEPNDGAVSGGATAARDRPATLGSDVRDARTLASTELRVRSRSLRANSRRLVAVGFLVLTFAVLLPLSVAGIVTGFGRRLASGVVPVGECGAVLAGGAAIGAYVGGVGGFNQEAAGAVGPLVRTSIPPRAVSLGRLASETAQGGALLGVIALALVVEVAIGAGSPFPALLLALAALPVLLASLFLGRILGDGVRLANRVLGLSLWTKAVLFLVVTVGAYVGSFALFSPEFRDAVRPGMALLPPLLPGEPLQAYASVVLAPLGSTPRPLGVLVAVAVLAAVPAALLVAVRTETWLLTRDPGADETDGAGPTVASRGVPRPFAATSSGRVAWRYLLRTRRDPRMLAHLGPLLFGLLGMAASLFQNPHSVFSTGPGAAVVLGATLAGAAYCLNPLGDDRDQLPLVLTSARSTAVLLRGRALAGLGLGLAVALGVAVPLGLGRGNVPLLLVEMGFAVFLAVSATGTALGIGAGVPRFERREYMSVERAHPSMVALIGFMIGGLFVGGVGLGLLWWTRVAADTAVAAGALATYLGVVGGVGVAGYVYAVRRFERLTLDDA